MCLELIENQTGSVGAKVFTCTGRGAGQDFDHVRIDVLWRPRLRGLAWRGTRSLGRLLAVAYWQSLGRLLPGSWQSLGCRLAVPWQSLGSPLAVSWQPFGSHCGVAGCRCADWKAGGLEGPRAGPVPGRVSGRGPWRAGRAAHVNQAACITAYKQVAGRRGTEGGRGRGWRTQRQKEQERELTGENTTRKSKER